MNRGNVVATPFGSGAVDAAEQGTNIEQRRLRGRGRWLPWGYNPQIGVVVGLTWLRRRRRLQRRLQRLDPAVDPGGVVAAVGVTWGWPCVDQIHI